HAGVRGVAANTRIHEDRASLRAQHIAAIVVVPGIRASEELRVAVLKRGPGLRRDGRKELAQGDGERAFTIGEGQDLAPAYEQFAFRHGWVPPSVRGRGARRPCTIPCPMAGAPEASPAPLWCMAAR